MLMEWFCGIQHSPFAYLISELGSNYPSNKYCLEQMSETQQQLKHLVFLIWKENHVFISIKSFVKITI